MPPEMPSAENSVTPVVAPETRPAIDLLGRSADELRVWMTEMGEPAYRGAQLYHALYAERRRDFSSMSNIPAALRTRLEREFRIGLPQIVRRYQSADGSVRYLLSLGETAGAAGVRSLPTLAWKPSSCLPRAARRFAFRRRQDVPWTAIFA